MHMDVPFFNTLPKISPNFQSIHHYIVNLKEVSVFNNLVLASCKICNQPQDKTVSAQTK